MTPYIQALFPFSLFPAVPLALELLRLVYVPKYTYIHVKHKQTKTTKVVHHLKKQYIVNIVISTGAVSIRLVQWLVPW